MIKKQSGFTVIELVVVIIFFIGVTVLAFFQLTNMHNRSENDKKRTAINSIYFSLEEGFYKQHGFYPENITDDTLSTLDPEMLTDPNGIKLGQPMSAYHYDSHGCQDGKCKAYTLRTTLKKEGDFVKESRNK